MPFLYLFAELIPLLIKFLTTVEFPKDNVETPNFVDVLSKRKKYYCVVV